MKVFKLAPVKPYSILQTDQDSLWSRQLEIYSTQKAAMDAQLELRGWAVSLPRRVHIITADFIHYSAKSERNEFSPFSNTQSSVTEKTQIPKIEDREGL